MLGSIVVSQAEVLRFESRQGLSLFSLRLPEWFIELNKMTCVWGRVPHVWRNQLFLNGAEGEVGSVVHSAGLCFYYPWTSFRRQECITISCRDLLSPRSDCISTWQCCRAGRSGTSPCWEETLKQNSSVTENHEVRGQQRPERCFKCDLQLF